MGARACRGYARGEVAGRARSADDADRQRRARLLTLFRQRPAPGWRPPPCSGMCLRPPPATWLATPSWSGLVLVAAPGDWIWLTRISWAARRHGGEIVDIIHAVATPGRLHAFRVRRPRGRGLVEPLRSACSGGPTPSQVPARMRRRALRLTGGCAKPWLLHRSCRPHGLPGFVAGSCLSLRRHGAPQALTMPARSSRHAL